MRRSSWTLKRVTLTPCFWPNYHVAIPRSLISLIFNYVLQCRKLRWRSHNFIFQSPSVWFWLGGPPRNTQAHPQIRPCSSDRVRFGPGSSSLALPQYLMVAVPWVSWQSLLPRGSSPHALRQTSLAATPIGRSKIPAPELHSFPLTNDTAPICSTKMRNTTNTLSGSSLACLHCLFSSPEAPLTHNYSSDTQHNDCVAVFFPLFSIALLLLLSCASIKHCHQLQVLINPLMVG